MADAVLRAHDPPVPQIEWLTIAQACDRASVSRRTIYNWLHAGKLQTCRTAGGTLRIAAGSLFRDDAASSGAK